MRFKVLHEFRDQEETKAYVADLKNMRKVDTRCHAELLVHSHCLRYTGGSAGNAHLFLSDCIDVDPHEDSKRFVTE